MFKSFEWSYHTDRHQYYNDFSTRNDLYASKDVRVKIGALTDAQPILNRSTKYISEELFGRSLVVGDGVTAADERPVLRAVTILASNGFLPSSIGNGIEQ